MSNAAQLRGAGARRWRAAPAVQVPAWRPATVRRGDGAVRQAGDGAAGSAASSDGAARRLRCAASR